MSVFQNAAELLAQFGIVKTCSQKEANPYEYMKEWFVAQFPNHRELPDFSTNVPKVIDFAAFQKKQEERKRA